MDPFQGTKRPGTGKVLMSGRRKIPTSTRPPASGLHGNLFAKRGSKMKAAILCTEKKPVPAVHGGAVETLVDLLLENNEVLRLADLDVYSIADDAAARRSSRFKNTSFHFINSRSAFNSSFNLLNRIFHKCRLHLYLNVYLNRAVKELKKHNYDWIIVENRPLYIRVLRKHLGENARIALHLHNDFLSKENYYAKSVIRSSDKVLAVSGYINKRVKEAAASERDQKKAAMLCNRIDVRMFRVNQESLQENILRKKFHLAPDTKIILYFGRIRKQKGVLELILAYEKALKKDSSLRLILIGESDKEDYMKKIEDAMRRLPPDCVQVIGYVNHGELPGYLAGADLIALPSVWREPFGLTVVESMAMAKPVISTDSGAIPELLGDGCGLLIGNGSQLIDHLSDALVMLAADPELREKLGLNARKKAVASYNSESYLSDLIEKLETP